MTKKLTSLLLALMLLAGLIPLVADAVTVSGAPDFEVTTTIVPGELTIRSGQQLTFTATTTYTSNKGDNQLLHFVSDQWQGVDAYEEAVLTDIEVEGQPAAGLNQRQSAFVSKASATIDLEPGDYDVVVRYQITLQHDNSGQRTYFTSAQTSLLTITVLEALPEDDSEQPDEPIQGQPLNHGQIVSAWAHWKQTKGNKNFQSGGPGVYRSLVWYKTQVEYRTFYAQQEVWDYLDSIYEPAPKHKQNKPDNPNKGPGNNNGKGK